MELQIFQTNGIQIRGGLIDNEPYFVLVDVCNALEIQNPSRVASEMLKKNGVRTTEVIDSLNRLQQSTIISEQNLYKLIFKSRKDEAEKFQDWVTGEVLPSIRKTGQYAKPLSYEEIMQNALQLADNKVKELQSKIEHDRPLVSYATSVQASVNSVLIREWVKELSSSESVIIGQNKAFGWLRQKGYLMHTNEPYQKYIENGYFELMPTTYATPNGTVKKNTTKITGKGQIALAEKIVSYFKGLK